MPYFFATEQSRYRQVKNLFIAAMTLETTLIVVLFADAPDADAQVTSRLLDYYREKRAGLDCKFTLSFHEAGFETSKSRTPLTHGYSVHALTTAIDLRRERPRHARYTLRRQAGNRGTDRFRIHRATWIAVLDTLRLFMRSSTASAWRCKTEGYSQRHPSNLGADFRLLGADAI